jgi:hypothetical protein
MSELRETTKRFVLTEKQLQAIINDAKEASMDDTPATFTKAAPAKSGWQTTEFWVTVLTAVGAVAAAQQNALPPRYAALASAVSVSAYAISRALAKM